MTSREFIDHAIDCGFFGKENRRVEQLISQIKNQLYIVEKAVEVKNKRGRKSDDQQSFLNYFFTSVVSTSMSNNKVSVVLKNLILYQRLQDGDYSKRLIKKK